MTKPFTAAIRKKRSTKERAELFKLRNGICYFCKGQIQANQKWDWVHEKALAMGGEDTIENSFIGHTKCHRGKDSPTSKDQSQIAEAKRKEAKRFNFKQPKQSIKGQGFQSGSKKPLIEKKSLPPRQLYGEDNGFTKII